MGKEDGFWQFSQENEDDYFALILEAIHTLTQHLFAEIVAQNSPDISAIKTRVTALNDLIDNLCGDYAHFAERYGYVQYNGQVDAVILKPIYQLSGQVITFEILNKLYLFGPPREGISIVDNINADSELIARSLTSLAQIISISFSRAQGIELLLFRMLSSLPPNKVHYGFSEIVDPGVVILKVNCKGRQESLNVRSFVKVLINSFDDLVNMRNLSPLTHLSSKQDEIAIICNPKDAQRLENLLLSFQ